MHSDDWLSISTPTESENPSPNESALQSLYEGDLLSILQFLVGEDSVVILYRTDG